MYVRAPVPAAEKSFLEQRQEKEVQRDGLLDAAEADDDAGSRLARRLEGLLDRALGADRLEGIVDAAALGEGADRLDRVRVARVHHVGRAERLRHLELRRLRVDGDDALRSGDGRTLDGVEPHAARAEDRDAAPRYDSRRVED